MTNKEIMELSYVRDELILIEDYLKMIDDFINEIKNLHQLKPVYAGCLHNWTNDIKELSKTSQKRLSEMVTAS